ncbi:MAG TPA: DUF1800 family protein [Xanthobacteraceae bacterium]|nr:DUF1800 family protein [Xanthobacteraceae bacterium]
MSANPSLDAALALHRFGFGPRNNAISKLAADPRGALLAELDHPGAALIQDPNLLDTGEIARAVFDFRQERKAVRFAQQADQMMTANANATPPAKPPGPGLPQQIYLAEAKAHFDRALDAETGFVERLVWFWSNHFCVSADKVHPYVGAFEREAIRPHVLGHFADMLLAVESHPAMLLYLDNAHSMGPDSIAGHNQHKGINENLAREIMELHTLGVRTGYSQADVTNFANVISGWSIFPPRDQENGGEFNFNARMHEPGPQTVAGHTYAGMGFDQGAAVLLDLARNPATAKHIATKLARHFVADDPPPQLVEALRASFVKSDGDLRELARTLLLSPEAWAAPRSKLKRPGEWLVATARATGVRSPDVRPLLNAQNMLGEPLWRPPAPKGFDDVNAAWMDGIAQRLEIANQVAHRVSPADDPRALVDTALGPLASAETRQAVARAETRPEAVAMLLMSAEFQRR